MDMQTYKKELSCQESKWNVNVRLQNMCYSEKFKSDILLIENFVQTLKFNSLMS